jgi:hypothetical protein
MALYTEEFSYRTIRANTFGDDPHAFSRVSQELKEEKIVKCLPERKNKATKRYREK